jgi:hypothetical protein
MGDHPGELAALNQIGAVYHGHRLALPDSRSDGLRYRIHGTGAGRLP